MKKLIAILCCGVIATGIISQSDADAKKKYTVYERQVELRKRVDKGQKDNELTLKEADGYRNRLDDINADVEKYKSKNGGKLSYKDEGKIEKRLNNLSLDIQKSNLNKRVVPK